MHYQYK